MGNNDTKLSPVNILNRSYDPNLDLIMVEVVGADGIGRNPATEETLQKIAGENYDNVIVDTTADPIFTITKKLGATVVDTKTITIV